MIELALASILGFYNTPYPREFTLLPSIEIRQQVVSKFFVSHMSALRTNPVSIGRFGVRQVTWDFKAGYESGRITMALGHQSQHGIDFLDPMAESTNYAVIKYRIGGE